MFVPMILLIIVGMGLVIGSIKIFENHRTILSIIILILGICCVVSGIILAGIH